MARHCRSRSVSLSLVQLTRETIVRAALDLLDTYGLADTTMRRVATSLGVAPGALYWHIANKQALIAAIGDAIVAPVLSPRPESTDNGDSADNAGAATASPKQLALALRECVLAHRDGAEVTTAALSQPENLTWLTLTGLVEDSLSARLPADTRRVAAHAIIHLTLGAATMEQAQTQLQEVQGPQKSVASSAQQTADSGAGASASHHASDAIAPATQLPTGGGSALSHGVDIILNGLAAQKSDTLKNYD